MKPYVVLLFCAAAASSLFAQAQWISLTTPHFEMYTTNAQAPAAQELQFLDEIRSFFAKAAPFSNKAEDLSVQIIAFRSEAEYAPYAFREAGGAYSLRTFNHDYMVLPNLASRERELVVHEFTHLVVQHAGFKLPVWLNEGLAEFYSTVVINKQKTTVGQPLFRHIQTIHRQQWIPWDVLFAVDANSPYYKDGKKVPLFYAQSWALVHMLALSEDYSKGFQQFLAAVSAGQTTSEAFESTYKRNMASIAGDLAAYLHRKALPQEVSASAQGGSQIQPLIGEPCDFQLNFTLANLLSGSRPRSPKRKANWLRSAIATRNVRKRKKCWAPSLYSRIVRRKLAPISRSPFNTIPETPKSFANMRRFNKMPAPRIPR